MQKKRKSMSGNTIHIMER